MCYYKIDFKDVALDQVNIYLNQHPESLTANNLKAAILYSYLGKTKDATEVLKELAKRHKGGNLIEENDLLRHNYAVFNHDESHATSKLKTFSNLVDIIPEAKTNLILYYLKNGQVNQAHNMVQDMQPASTKDYIIIAIVHYLLACKGEKREENEKKAYTYFHSVGASSSDCDTIEGRQCMASCMRISNLYSDEETYLDSIEEFMSDDDNFNWNYALALVGTQKYEEAESKILRIKDPKVTGDEKYLLWLCRIYILNGKPELVLKKKCLASVHFVAERAVYDSSTASYNERLLQNGPLLLLLQGIPILGKVPTE